jgi:hypothetical protein
MRNEGGVESSVADNCRVPTSSRYFGHTSEIYDRTVVSDGDKNNIDCNIM